MMSSNFTHQSLVSQVVESVISNIEQDILSKKAYIEMGFECDLTDEMADEIQKVSVKIQTLESLVQWIKQFKST